MNNVACVRCDESLSMNGAAVSLPESGSLTCLDLQALDVQNTRKMRDDSKIHHILEDVAFRARKKVINN